MTRPPRDVILMLLTDALARVVAAAESIICGDVTEAGALLTDIEYDLAGAIERVMADA